MFWLRKSLGSKCDEVERQSCRWTLGFVQSWPDNSFYFPNSRTVNQSMQSGYPKAMKVGVNSLMSLPSRNKMVAFTGGFVVLDQPDVWSGGKKARRLRKS